MRKRLAYVLLFCLPCLSLQGDEYPEPVRKQWISFHWNGKNVNWLLCFDRPILLGNLFDMNDLRISYADFGEGFVKYNVTSISDQGAESLSVGRVSFLHLDGCSNVEIGSDNYPLTDVSGIVGIEDLSDFRMELTGSQKQPYAAMFVSAPLLGPNESEEDAAFFLHVSESHESHQGEQQPVDHSEQGRVVKRNSQNDNEGGGNWFVRSKEVSPLIALGIGIGGVVLGYVSSAPCFCALGYRCHRKIQRAGN